MSTATVVPQRCDECGAQLAPLDGAVCASCGRLLCRRHFPRAGWRGVLSRTGAGLLCGACQALPPRPPPRR